MQIYVLENTRGEMTMFRVALCDDDKKFIEKLRRIVALFLKKKNILYQIDLYDSGKKFEGLGLEMAKYQVLFLDINMEQMRGIETAICFKGLCKEKFLVLVTARTDCILEGYKMGAFRYVLKNDGGLEGEICESLGAICDKMHSLSFIRTFQFKNYTKKIALERILYIESHLHELFFHVLENELAMYTMTETLNRIEKELSMNDFVRIHQSYLVNLRFVAAIKSQFVILLDGTKLAIAKPRYKGVKRCFNEYHRKCEVFSGLYFH